MPVESPKGGIISSVRMVQAEEAMKARSLQLRAYDFKCGSKAQVICEDGSVFLVSDAFIEEWTDQDDAKWLFLFCEHYKSMCFDVDDVVHWANIET